jgi:hypothetical protein
MGDLSMFISATPFGGGEQGSKIINDGLDAPFLGLRGHLGNYSKKIRMSEVLTRIEEEFAQLCVHCNSLA